MNITPTTPQMGGSLANLVTDDPIGVVEIGLLLPARRAAALLRLAEDRQQSVAQVLRKLIDRELSGSI